MIDQQTCPQPFPQFRSSLWFLNEPLNPVDVEAMGLVFRELLLDAMIWDGQLDFNRKVRLAYLLRMEC